MIGLSFTPPPRFARRYANVAEVMHDALARFAEDIRKGRFPAPEESYPTAEELPADWDRSL